MLWAICLGGPVSAHLQAGEVKALHLEKAIKREFLPCDYILIWRMLRRLGSQNPVTEVTIAPLGCNAIHWTVHIARFKAKKPLRASFRNTQVGSIVQY